jgi:hypothetical protein
LLDHCIYDINFIEFETSPEEDEEEEWKKQLEKELM